LNGQDTVVANQKKFTWTTGDVHQHLPAFLRWIIIQAQAKLSSLPSHGSEKHILNLENHNEIKPMGKTQCRHETPLRKKTAKSSRPTDLATEIRW